MKVRYIIQKKQNLEWINMLTKIIVSKKNNIIEKKSHQ